METLIDTARELWSSPTGQRLLHEGVLPVADALRKNRRGARGTLIGTVVDEILERRSARQAAA